MNNDMATIKNNRDKMFDDIGNFLSNFGNGLVRYFKTISERTLTISTIVILHSIFLPSTIAYLTALTERTPSIDSVLLVLLALSIMAINAIIKKDMLAICVHMLGFLGNTVLLALVVFK